MQPWRKNNAPDSIPVARPGPRSCVVGGHLSTERRTIAGRQGSGGKSSKEQASVAFTVLRLPAPLDFMGMQYGAIKTRAHRDRPVPPPPLRLLPLRSSLDPPLDSPPRQSWGNRERGHPRIPTNPPPRATLCTRLNSEPLDPLQDDSSLRRRPPPRACYYLYYC